jgi:hypothetical protein
MTISWELNATTLLLLAVNLIGLIWFVFSTQATASAAHRQADRAHERIAALAEAESIWNTSTATSCASSRPASNVRSSTSRGRRRRRSTGWATGSTA